MSTETPTMATVSTKGQLVIPIEMRESLGIAPGTKVALRIEGSRIIVQPVTGKLIEELKGMFAGGPSMADELQSERRSEDKKW